MTDIERIPYAQKSPTREELADIIRRAGSPYWKPLSGARSIMIAEAILDRLAASPK